MKPMIYSYNRVKPDILFEGKYMNYQFYILNLGTHPTAYVEIPITSIFYNKKYDEIYFSMGIDIDVHFGLTYSEDYLLNKYNSWFIGWDYGHFSDYCGLDLNPINIELGFVSGGKKWTTEEIYEDVKKCINQLISYDK